MKLPVTGGVLETRDGEADNARIPWEERLATSLRKTRTVVNSCN